ncbi:MAG: archaeosine biosynthesis radical SAM protein RaSEA [Candidatus Omnitrophota bacterium]
MMSGILTRVRLDRVNKNLLGALISLMGIKIAHTFYKYDHVSKKPVLNATLLLPGKGCSWAKDKSGGCTMCGFKNALSSLGIDRIFNDDEIARLFELGWSSLVKKQPRALNIYNGGSFFNDEEISRRVQDMVIEKARGNIDLEILLVESRPEYINPIRIQEITARLKPKKLKIGIGLESVTDRVRNDYINKGMSKESYEGAIKTAKLSGARILTYVLIKPLYLSEKEAVEEAIKTARYAFDTGSDEVSFEASCIQKGTRMEELYRQGKYRPPWLWSMIEVIRVAHVLGDIQIGSFSDFPFPSAKPGNCGHCSAKVEKLLSRYRINHVLSIFETIDCDCKNTWKELMKGD